MYLSIDYLLNTNYLLTLYYFEAECSLIFERKQDYILVA